MRTLLFLFSFLFLSVNIFPLELKYLGKNGGYFCLENTSKKKLKKNLEGFFFTVIKYRGKYEHAKIAKFRIFNIDENTVIAEVIQWGIGWENQDIKGAVIDDRLLEEREISKELIKKMNFPGKFQYLLYKTDRVYLNSTGYWEAVINDIVMIYIPGGIFFNGDNHNDEDEEPGHKVYLSGYWISKYEISFKQFDLFCKETKREYPDDDDFGRGNYPVYNVSWYDAVRYCEWLSQKTGLTFKLPTEAQWEKAARGTGKRNFPWGFHKPFYNNKFYANYYNRVDGYPFYTPVKSFTNGASPYGVVNMSGNVAEWTNDWYDADFYSNKINKDPLGAKNGNLKVTRGGSYISLDFSLRLTNREPQPPHEKNNYTGFRIVLLKNE